MHSHISVFTERSIEQPFWGKSEISGIARATFPSPKLIWTTTVENVCTSVFFLPVLPAGFSRSGSALLLWFGAWHSELRAGFSVTPELFQQQGSA